MGRRVGFFESLARDAARKKRAADVESRKQEAAQRKAARDHERWSKRAQAEEEKEGRKQYLEERIQEADDQNKELEDKIATLKSILAYTLKTNDSIPFQSLLIAEEYPPFAPPENLRSPIKEPEKGSYLNQVTHPGKLALLLPWAKKKYELEIQLSEDAFKAAQAQWREDEEARNDEIEEIHKEYEKKKDGFEKKKQRRSLEVAEFEKAYRAGDPEAIVNYCNMVLQRSEYPDDFPQEFRLAYVPESKQLVIEYQLPNVEVVPSVLEYRYIKAKDEIAEKPRKQAEIREIYQDVVASVALRTIHEIFEADQIGHIEVVCFNGLIQTVDPSTGKDIKPHLISVRTTRERFCGIELGRVEKRLCLKNLGAQVSPRPAEAQAVKPIIEFNMVDKRFVEQSDVLSGLESRPNLMEMNPFEFEHLVANLFGQMGLESKLTRSSKDGGVDCVAFDPRPVLGGKVVIQAKRYRHTVGVSAVRDLYGTMMNEGANKGILVTTSGYGPDAFEFAKDKPIELIEGGGLLYLLQQIGVEARIIFPQE
jgi:restriction system protein